MPEIVVESDYDGYFERLVEGWLAQKPKTKHQKIVISAGPYRASAMSYSSDGETIWLDFYSAFRVGFGSLSEDEITQIIELL